MNEKAFNKARKIIDEVVDKGNLKKYKLSLDEFHEFNRCVYELWKSERVQVFTIREKVKDLLVKCGFEAIEDGIGWMIK